MQRFLQKSYESWKCTDEKVMGKFQLFLSRFLLFLPLLVSLYPSCRLYFGCMLLSTAILRLEFTICPFVLLFFNLHSSMRLHQYFVFSSPTPPYFPSLKMCSFRFFFVCDFNNVLFTFPWIEPTIACWPILTPFEHHLQSVTVLDNERDLPIVWSFQAIFSFELNGFQMEELAGRKKTKWSVVSEWLC